MRIFWDMQQNQEIHKDANWQAKMVQMEMRVQRCGESIAMVQERNMAALNDILINEQERKKEC